MPSLYIVTEASPSTTSYLRCGRGGAGNVFRASSSSSPTATITASSGSSGSGRFFSGIGGAGNAHSTARLPSVKDSLDDAVRHATARDNASVGHCGRGGAGNIFRRKDGDAASLLSSSGSSSKSERTSGTMWGLTRG